MSISDVEITAFSKYILDISSIYLDSSKGYLLETRLKDMMDATKAVTYSELLDKIKADSTRKLQSDLIDAISTNETFFFRDNVPFDLLRNKIIPSIIDLRRAQNPSQSVSLRIWSAACSTGQEVYSIAITLLDMLAGMGTFNISILGTDLSGQAIAQASYGQYNRFEIERGLREDKRLKYFTQSGDGWRIRDEVRSLARFEVMNLTQPFPAALGPFDVVFCRNVAIYFQNQDKVNLFKRIARVLAPGGALIVGGSENLMAIAPDFKGQQYLRGMFYILKKDSDISLRTVVETPIRSPSPTPPITRKTVYDKKRPSVSDPPPPKSIPKPAPRLETKESPKPEKPRRLLNEAVISEPSAKYPTETAEKKEGEESKPSLLSVIQKKHQRGGALLDEKAKESSPKESLLDKIANRNRDQ